MHVINVRSYKLNNNMHYSALKKSGMVLCEIIVIVINLIKFNFLLAFALFFFAAV